MKTRIVHTKFWQDSFVAELTLAEKGIFLYLLTNDRVNIIHCYECPDRTILFDTGATKEQLESAKQKLEAAGKVFFFQNHVYLANADKYEQYNGERHDAARQTLEREMAASVFDWYKSKRDTPFIPPFATLETPQKGILKHNTETINHKEGGMGETTPVRPSPQDPAYLIDLPPEDSQDFGQKFNLSLEAISDKAEAMHDWYLANPRRNKRDNWKSVLRNALRDDAGKLRAKHGPYKPPGYTPTPQDWEFLKMGMVDIFIGEAKIWAEEQIRNGTVVV